MEHLLDLDAAMKSIKSYIKYGGMVIVEVPDYSKINQSSFPLANYFNQEHINYFSNTTLNNIFERYGFTNTTHDFLYNSTQLGKEYSILNSYRLFSTDKITHISINDYLHKEKIRKEQRRAIIDKTLALNKNVVIWGTGSYLASLYAETNISKLKIQYFIDNNKSKEGRTLFDIPIKMPNTDSIKKDDIIIITSMQYAKQIEKQIRTELKLDNDILII